MMHAPSLHRLDKDRLLREFAALVEKDRRDTATLLAYIAEIDRRKLYLEHACPSMFAFCTTRFHMSEAVAARRIRAGRATCRFPCILGMVARGELHLSGIHQLAGHLTDENHQEILRRARHRSMREIERLIAEIVPKPDVPSSIRALPIRKSETQSSIDTDQDGGSTTQPNNPVRTSVKQKSRPVPLAPRRYRLQVTIGEETRNKLNELQGLLSHQIPDGDPAEIFDRALDALLTETKKRKAGLTDKPRRTQKKKGRGRGIPARARREVFERDEGRCAFTDAEGRRCSSTWQVEFHHRVPYARGGTHDVENIELRCRAHNQHEAEVEYGVGFITSRRRSGEAHARSS
ncbi:MAG: HNH endonuclease [Deltaproteobacteria bacterium]|nr:HNH endonuclease [Deltaproteobacteria bacterium]MBW2160922.1 HNH endonuclease [Deltaproteobacteria bacterium]MBW2687466.1 HNH endonuclease [Deltaproteobacteria bacterium]